MNRADFERKWLKAFVPHLNKEQYEDCHLKQFLWHVFSYGVIPKSDVLSGEAAIKAYDSIDKEGAIAIELPFPHSEAETAPIPEKYQRSKSALKRQELYIVGRDWAWTFVSTHENGWLGPYFYFKGGASRMVYGAINEKGEAWYTDLKRVFEAIQNRQKEYNWLITDCICYPNDPQAAAMFREDYCWLSGEELTALVEKENFQWIWAVLSAFDKTVTLAEVLKYELPQGEDYEGFWRRPLSIQHPLARIEIVPWDSSLTMIFSDDKSIINSFRAYYPESKDMLDYLQ